MKERVKDTGWMGMDGGEEVKKIRREEEKKRRREEEKAREDR